MFQKRTQTLKCKSTMGWLFVRGEMNLIYGMLHYFSQEWQ